MKLSTMFLLALAAGCAKTSDIGPIRDNANQLIARTTPELDEAGKHLADLGGKLPTAAVAAVNDATQLIGTTRSEIAAAQQALDTAEKAGKPEDMEKVKDELAEKLEHARGALTVDLNTIDALVFQDASWPKPVVAQVAPAPTETDSAAPTP